MTLLLKKHGLDADDPANYRPISNLNTVSKLLEQLVLSRVISHVSSSPSFDAVQSVYRRQHSTETALLKITNDIYAGFDTHQSTILAALDQSAAFDCIDHEIMINRLQHTFGVTDLALSWFVSYFAARSMSVRRCSISAPCVDPIRLRCPAGIRPWTSVLQSIRGPSVMCDITEFIWRAAPPICR